jgi:rubredoxin
VNPYRTPAPFTCPECGAQHDRGWVDGVETYRCLGCGYTGKNSNPRPMSDEEFEESLNKLLETNMGPFYVSPMLVVRLRKVFRASYDPPAGPQRGVRSSLVGTLYGAEVYQTGYIPDGWVYAPPGGDHDVLRRKAADPQYLHQLDSSAKPPALAIRKARDR